MRILPIHHPVLKNLEKTLFLVLSLKGEEFRALHLGKLLPSILPEKGGVAIPNFLETMIRDNMSVSTC